MPDEPFTETVNTIAPRVPCDPSLVRNYAAWGWVECRTLANGMRLFKSSAVERIRTLRAERMARRGKYRRAGKAHAPAELG